MRAHVDGRGSGREGDAREVGRAVDAVDGGEGVGGRHVEALHAAFEVGEALGGAAAVGGDAVERHAAVGGGGEEGRPPVPGQPHAARRAVEGRGEATEACAGGVGGGDLRLVVRVVGVADRHGDGGSGHDGRAEAGVRCGEERPALARPDVHAVERARADGVRVRRRVVGGGHDERVVAEPRRAAVGAVAARERPRGDERVAGRGHVEHVQVPKRHLPGQSLLVEVVEAVEDARIGRVGVAVEVGAHLREVAVGRGRHGGVLPQARLPVGAGALGEPRGHAQALLAQVGFVARAGDEEAPSVGRELRRRGAVVGAGDGVGFAAGEREHEHLRAGLVALAGGAHEGDAVGGRVPRGLRNAARAEGERAGRGAAVGRDDPQVRAVARGRAGRVGVAPRLGDGVGDVPPVRRDGHAAHLPQFVEVGGADRLRAVLRTHHRRGGEQGWPSGSTTRRARPRGHAGRENVRERITGSGREVRRK